MGLHGTMWKWNDSWRASQRTNLGGDLLAGLNRSSNRNLLGGLLLCFITIGCGGDGNVEATSASGSNPGGGALGSTATVRSQDARVQSLREALEDGWVDVAEELLPEVLAMPEMKVEGLLLEARWLAQTGKSVEAAKRIEQARALDETDPRVWATGVELAIIDKRQDTARQRLQTGQQICGNAPELMRADAILSIYQPGLRQGRKAVDLIERALQIDPDLPFVRWSHSEANRLLAMSEAGTHLSKAIEHAEKAVSLAHENQEARELLGDLYMVDKRWGQGIEIFEALLAEGRPIGMKVQLSSKKAAMVAIAQGEKTLALEYFTRARELGMVEADLGVGAGVLQRAAVSEVQLAKAALEEGDSTVAEGHFARAERHWPESPELGVARSDQELDEGIRAMEGGRLEEAQTHFESALALDARSLMARHLLGRTLIERGQYKEAGEAWQVLMNQAFAEGIALPDPVHLDLARALALQDRLPEACRALQDYLDYQPQGAFLKDTRALLDQLQK